MTQAQIVKRPQDEVIRVLSDERTRSAIAGALPASMTFDRFKGAVVLAVLRTPELADDMRGLLLACQQCASDGLLPDGREAALVVYFTSTKQADGGWKKVPKVQYQPMVFGLMKLARNSGEISTMSARVVRGGDQFEVEYGDEERLTHRPRLDGEPGRPPTHVYAIAVMRDGGREREVMSWAEVGDIMRRSKSAVPDADGRPTKGPWASDPDEMAKKTVLRRLMKRLPRSTQLESALERGDEIATAHAAITPASFALSSRLALSPAADVETIDFPTEPEPEAEPVRPSRSQRIADAITATEQTGPTKAAVLTEAEEAHAAGAEPAYLRAVLERDGLFDDAAVESHLSRIAAPAAAPKQGRRRGFEE